MSQSERRNTAARCTQPSRSDRNGMIAKGAGGVCASMLVVGLLVGATTLPASAQLVGPSQTYDGSQEMSQSGSGPVVVMTWRVPDRFSMVPRTFDDVNPTSWRVEVDTCRSYSTSGTVRSIRWKLFDRAGQLLLDTTTCRRWATVPALGRYRVDVTVSATDGTTSSTRWIEIRDHLIVVAGDSMASGEGNPDVKGNARFEICGQSIDPSNAHVEVGLDPYCVRDLADLSQGDVPSVLDGRPSTWRLDPDCHRSYRSGMSLAARDIEVRDPHSSVTFINVACSGAQTRHIHSDIYDGLYTAGPWDTGVKAPQADQIAALVCGRIGSCEGSRVRPIDGLFLSIGINDLHLSDVLKDCMKPDFKQVLGVDGCHDSSFDTVEKGLSGLGTGMNKTNARFTALGLPIKSVYHAVYPTDVFTATATGCGVFHFINPMEMEWLQETNVKLNDAVRRVYSHEYHWRPVWRDQMADPWPGHGYCTGSNRYFVSLFDSLTQYNGLGDKVVYGAVHPNAKGHDVFRREFLNEYDQRTRPVTDHLVVTIEGVQVKTVETSGHGWLVFGAGRQGTDGVTRFGNTRSIEIPDELDVRPGTWVDLRSRDIKLDLGLNEAERLRVNFISSSNMPALETRCPNPETSTGGATLQRAANQSGSGGAYGEVACLVPVVRGFKMERSFAKSAGWGTGDSRTAVDSTGNFTVRYNVARRSCSICPPLESAPNQSVLSYR